jgi:hypothetical protein
MPSATNARAPNTALVTMSSWERSLMGMPHMAFVALMEMRASLRVQVDWTQVWMERVRGAEVQMQGVSVGVQRV